MKKTLLTILSLAFFGSAFAQPSPAWTILQNTNFPQTSTGVKFLDAVDASTVWLTGYWGVTGNSTKNYNWWSKTTNGGTSYNSGLIWTSTLTPAIGDTASWVLANLEGIDGNTAWVSAFGKPAPQGKGAVFKTTDGGATWLNMNSAQMFTNTTAFTNWVTFLTPSVGVCNGDPVNGEFELWRTADAGATWTMVPGANIPNPIAGEFALVNIYTKLGNTIWFGTNKNRVYKSMDAGVTWSVSAQMTSTLNGGNILGVNDIAFYDQNNGLLSTYFGPTGSGSLTLWNTSDGGVTWNMIPSVDPNLGINDFCAIPGTSKYASCGAGNGNTILSYSQDNGVTWIDWGSQNIQYLYMDFPNSSVGWAGSFSSATLATQDGVYKYSGPNLFAPLNANAAFTTPNGCSGVAITMTNTSAGAPVPNYTWAVSPAASISSVTAINPSIIFPTPGTYTISLSANNGGTTSTVSKTVSIVCVGIEENVLLNQNFSLYPNPTSNVINIEVANVNSYNYQITDLLGKVIMSDRVYNQDRTSVNVSSINKGIYFLTIESSGQKATKKIVIE
jgi:hypothetical protein